MKFNKTNGLVSLVFSLLVGCASYSARLTNRGWIEYHKNGMQVEMIENDKGKTYFCRIPIYDTDYFVEGVNSRKSYAVLKAQDLLSYINFLGINNYFLDIADENDDKLLNNKEFEKYHYLKTYFYKRVDTTKS